MATPTQCLFERRCLVLSSVAPPRFAAFARRWFHNPSDAIHERAMRPSTRARQGAAELRRGGCWMNCGEFIEPPSNEAVSASPNTRCSPSSLYVPPPPRARPVAASFANSCLLFPFLHRICSCSLTHFRNSTTTPSTTTLSPALPLASPPTPSSTPTLSPPATSATAPIKSSGS